MGVHMKPKFKYPVGPGTPAWAAFDRAETAHATWRESVINGRGDLRALKRYYNQRQYMVDLLRKHGEPVKPWTRTLNAAIGKIKD
jgi:hypothetical protein